jgi:hypothetical protein
MEKDYAEARNWFELAVVNYDLAVARLNLVLMYSKAMAWN